MSKVVDVIKFEITNIVARSLKLKKKLDKAKTKPKIELYQKKLRKSNIELAEMLIAFDRLEEKNKEDERIQLGTTDTPIDTE